MKFCMVVKNGEESLNPQFEGAWMVFPPGHLTTLTKTTPITNFANFDPILIKFDKKIKNRENSLNIDFWKMTILFV